MDDQTGAVKALLVRIREGSAEAKNELIDLLYQDFKEQAQRKIKGERRDHTWGPTDLTHEVVLRLRQNNELAKATTIDEVFRAFALAMKHLLIDHSRKKKTLVRGGDRQRTELDDVEDQVQAESGIDVLALHAALVALSREHPRAAVVLELRFFGGLGLERIAVILSGESAPVPTQIANAEGAGAGPVSLSTVERASRLGLAWIRKHLGQEFDP